MSQVSYNINHFYQTIDTAFVNVGTNNEQTLPNFLIPYDPNIALADTLIFNSGTTGVEHLFGDVANFTYSASTGQFDDGQGPSVTLNLIVKSPTQIEVISYEGAKNHKKNSEATFFQKVQ